MGSGNVKKRLIALALCVLCVMTLLPVQVFAASKTRLKITKQPISTQANIGETVSTTVVAQGDGLKYQWYVKNPGMKGYVKSSIKDKTYSYTMTAAKDGRKVYCVVKDKYGKKVTSNKVTLTTPTGPKITEQPTNAAAQIGERAYATVKAAGVDLQYIWYIQNPGMKGFAKSSITGDTYSFGMTEEKSGRKAYCLVVDRNGKSVKSNTVTMKIPAELKITAQPKNAGAASGQRVQTTVKAQGDGLKYQWYLYEPGSGEAQKSSITNATYSCTMTAAKSGRKVYCVITDTYGNSVTTDTALLKIPATLKITKQPTNVYDDIGVRVSTTVKAAGDGLTYQWYIQNPGMTGFAKSSKTEATYSFEMSLEKSGRRVYCVVTDMFGRTVKSNTVTMAVTEAEFERSLYKIKPGKSCTPQLQIKPAGKTDEIVWTSSDPSVAKVNADGVITGVKYGTVTITARGVNTGFVASCKIKVCNVKQVAITFDDGPGKRTGELLDFLKENDIRVTFFLVGNRLNSYKNTVKRQVAEGHEIGYHSWKHDIQTKLDSAQIISDYNRSNNILRNISGAEFTLWRTPGGGYSSRVLNCIDLPHIMWSVDTLDWKYRDSDRTYKVIKNNAKDGAIILLHDIHSSTVTGAMKALKEMQDGDYEFLTVTELLSRNGKTPKPNCTYSRG